MRQYIILVFCLTILVPIFVLGSKMTEKEMADAEKMDFCGEFGKIILLGN